jgi:hypothetical protein
MDLEYARTKSLHSIVVESQTDDGEWIESLHSNERSAADFERRMQKKEVPTRRKAA